MKRRDPWVPYAWAFGVGCGLGWVSVFLWG